jgi:hypothetical protein
MFFTHSCELESINPLDARQQRVPSSELIQDFFWNACMQLDIISLVISFLQVALSLKIPVDNGKVTHRYYGHQIPEFLACQCMLDFAVARCIKF